MRKLIYKLTYDTGFAPNPYGNYLTLAACTPNHMRSSLKVGEYLIGVESNTLSCKRKNASLKLETENSLIYIAKVSEILSLDEYYRDKRFYYKKFNSDSYKTRRGDNIYYQDSDGNWKWTDSDHDWDEIRKQDIRGNRVFISDTFVYLGDICEQFDSKFENLVPNRGIKYVEQNDLFDNYIENIISRYGYGRHGNPINYTLRKQAKENENNF